MRKLGMIVFSSDTGLGNQSRRLTYLVKPERILLVDNTPFTQNKQQHPEWYEGFTGYTCVGFPKDKEVDVFLNGLTHLFILENPLNWRLVRRAKQLGIKVYIHCNYEFCDNLQNESLPIPDNFIMPSTWHFDTMQKKYGNALYLPPPIDPNDFKEARERNFSRKSHIKKFVHVVGTLASNDRNGTLSLLESLKYVTANFILEIRSQHPLSEEYQTKDSRVIFKYGNEPEVGNIYKDYDAMILPRRFGGLCLPMGEALMSGLPVLMTDISPNHALLEPTNWLVKSKHKEYLEARTRIDVYEAIPEELGKKIQWLCETDIDREKLLAFDIAHTAFAPSSLRDQYEALWQM